MYPTLFEIGNFQLSTFGVMVALGVLVGGEMSARSFDRFGRGREEAWSLVTWCIIGGMLGAKLWYVGEQVIRTPESGVVVWLLSRGGLTWYGGLLGGTIAGLVNARRKGVPIPLLVNLAAPALAVGQALGRVGCLLVGDDYGRPTELPWGIAFPQGLPPTLDPVHPTMVYESLWLFAAGAWLWSRRGRSPFLFGEYLLIAGAGRLWIELLRVNPTLLGPLTNAQVAAVCCIVLGGLGWLWALRRRSAALRPKAGT